MKEDILIKDFPQSKGEHKLLKKTLNLKSIKPGKHKANASHRKKKGNVSCSTF